MAFAPETPDKLRDSVRVRVKKSEQRNRLLLVLLIVAVLGLVAAGLTVGRPYLNQAWSSVKGMFEAEKKKEEAPEHDPEVYKPVSD